MAEVEISLFDPPRYAKIGGTTTYPITLRNLTDKTIPSQRLILQANSYFSTSSMQVPEIAPYAEEKVTFVTQISGYKSVEDVSETNVFRLSTSKINTPTWRVGMHSFIGGLTDFSPVSCCDRSKQRYNILLYGVVGAGKSTIINSFLTLLSPGYDITTIAPVGGGKVHNTTQLTRYTPEDSAFRFAFWDTWGITADTYHNDDVENILDGIFPSGWGMDFKYDKFKEELELNMDNANLRAIHSIIFVVPQHALQENNEYAEIVRTNFMKVKDYNPIVLISRLDEICPGIESNPFERGSEVQVRIKAASSVLGIPQYFIHPVVSYTGPSTQKKFNIDKHNYKILSMALDRASTNYRKKLAVCTEQAFDWGDD